MNQQQLPPFQCAQCGGTESNVHLRHVTVILGWMLTKLEAVVPCTVCRTCGNITVGSNIQIGKYVGPLPAEPTPPPRGGNVVELPRPPVAENAQGQGTEQPQVAGAPVPAVGSEDDRR